MTKADLIYYVAAFLVPGVASFFMTWRDKEAESHTECCVIAAVSGFVACAGFMIACPTPSENALAPAALGAAVFVGMLGKSIDRKYIRGKLRSARTINGDMQNDDSREETGD